MHLVGEKPYWFRHKTDEYQKMPARCYNSLTVNEIVVIQIVAGAGGHCKQGPQNMRKGRRLKISLPRRGGELRTDKGAVVTIDEVGKSDLDNSPWTEMIREELKA